LGISNSPHQSEGKQEKCADEFESQTYRKSKNPEREQHQPKQWKEEQQEQGQRPAHDQ